MMSRKRISQSVTALILSLVIVQLHAADEVFSDIHGQEMRMSDFLGKWVVVNYWATWCPPCLEELPELEHFHAANRDDKAVVLGFNTESLSHAELSRFADDYMLSFPIISSEQATPSFGAIPGLPTTFLIDPQGKTVARQVGPVTADMIESFIAKKP
jgi:thiol-disulfide isomerase/thioredoxin